jgi:hypothetical protein
MPARAGRDHTVRTRIATVLGLGLALGGLTTVGAAPADAATPVTVYASPSGGGSACTSSAPCSLAGAQARVEAIDQNMSANINVELYGGVYRLSSPLQLGPADSGSNGYYVLWQAVAGQVPVFSGAVQVTGFTAYNSALNIWRAPVPAAAAAGGQQLFVNGQRAQLAQSSGPPPGLTVTSTGFATTDSSYAAFANQSRIQVVDNSDWKHESCPVSSITAAPGGGSDINILPSCWSANHTTVPNLGFPFNGNGLPAMSGISYLENAYPLLTRPGQFYLDPTADYLYYIPAAGQAMATADVELPLVQSLLYLQGTPGHLAPVNQNAPGSSYSGGGWFLSANRNYGDLGNQLEATGTNGDSVSYTFTGTGLEVLGETYTDEGSFNAYVDGVQDTTRTWTENTSGSTRLAQQVIYSVQGLTQGTHTVKIAKTGGSWLTVNGFVATPNPITPVSHISFTGITFTGTTWTTPQTTGYLDNQAGVLWNTATAPTTPTIVPAAVTVSRGQAITFSGDVFDHLGATAVHLADGTQNSTITASTITDTAGGGISVGNVEDYFQNNTALMTSGDTLSDNAISFIGRDYSDDVGIWAGYTRNLTIANNDIGYTPYSGISLGWGWGWQSDCTLQAKQGLSTCVHGTDYAEGNQITGNYVHDVMGLLHDGGPIYTNGGQGLGTGAASGPCQAYSTLSGNVLADGNDTNNMIYHDEGSSCWNTYNNVTEFGGSDWTGMWTPTINTINFHDNYTDNANYYNNGTNVTFTQATIVSGGAWPAAAQSILAAAGVPQQYAPVTGRIDDDSLAITYTGGWAHSGFRVYGDFDNGVHYTQANGASASLTFTGTGVQVIGETNTDQGNDEIYLDGADKGAVNTNTSSRATQQVIYSVSNLTPGSHTVKIVKNSGQYSTLDGFEITSTVNDTAPAIAYTGTSWAYSTSRGLGDYADDVHYTTGNGDAATVSFYGTGIIYYTETNSDEGIIGVSLDGASQGTVNAYTATHTAQQALYSVSGLPLGLHTLTLTKQSGTYLLVDRFDVQ